MGSWHGALGLEQDPFATPGPFFEGGARHSILQQAVQQLHFGGGCVAVLGEQGSGVTTLLGVVPDALQGVADTLSVPAAELSEPSQPWTTLAAFLGARSAPAKDDESAIEALATAWNQMKPADGGALPLVLVIDNAQQLPAAVLHGLLQFQQRIAGDLRILLGGTPELLQRLPATATDWLCLRLAALDSETLADYVLSRLQAAGYRGSLPLDALQRNALCQHTRGLPGAVPEWLPRVLARSRQPVQHRLHGVSLIHVLMAALLLTLLGVMLLYYREDAPTLPAATVDAPLNTGQVRDVDPQLLLPSPHRQEQVPVTAAGLEKGRGGLQTISAEWPSPVEASEPTRAMETASSSSSEYLAPEYLEREAPAQALTEDERDLLALPAESYVLQLFGARDIERVTDFVRTAAPAFRIYLFETRLQGKPWHVAVSGPYRDAAHARLAEADLPAALRVAKPWPRPQQDISRAILSRQLLDD